MPADNRDASVSSNPLLRIFGAVTEYMIDAAQRSVLYCDVMRQRGNAYLEHAAKEVPHVLDYQVELVIDGRKLDRPVNYGLVRIIPPAGMQVEPDQAPVCQWWNRAPATVLELVASKRTVRLASR